MTTSSGIKLTIKIDGTKCKNKHWKMPNFDQVALIKSPEGKLWQKLHYNQ